MRVILEIDRFLKGMILLKGIIERRATMPILSNVLIKVSKDGIILQATDLECSMEVCCNEAICAAELIEGIDDSITVAYKFLLDLLKSNKTGQVVMESASEDREPIVSLTFPDGFVYKLPGLSATEFPSLPKVPKLGVVGAIDKEVLKGMLEDTIGTVSKNESRYNVQGIFFEYLSGGVVRAVSTNGHALTFKSGYPFALSSSFTIPIKGAQELIKLLSDKSVGELNFSMSGSNLYFHGQLITLIVRKIDEIFPDYRSVIPQEIKHVIQIDRKHLIETLSKFSGFVKTQRKGVVFSIHKDHIDFSIDRGESKVEVTKSLTLSREVGSIEPDGCIRTKFCATYILGALNRLGTKLVELELTDDIEKPLTIREGAFSSIVMPLNK